MFGCFRCVNGNVVVLRVWVWLVGEFSCCRFRELFLVCGFFLSFRGLLESRWGRVGEGFREFIEYNRVIRS